ncbi:M14 family metallopeptidase [Flammeovirga sp. EKP202]|uniref:M14 family metallopeptidase n=1 Tax=Flammeovirga sp. EKP202 TaxID=2770592 RepID=UPI003460A051
MIQLRRTFLIIGLFTFIFSCSKNQTEEDIDWQTLFEKSNGTETFTYEEGMAYFHQLGDSYEAFRVVEYGKTDSGYPLNVGIYSKESTFIPSDIKKKNVLLINNAIHPGEPDGVDASMMLMRDLLQGKVNIENENTIVAIIPFYNIGGALNRNSSTRANQDGPHEYGFRGNAKNLDLNRDFIKMDSENMRSFAEIFHLYEPELFIDTHVSNGADYQHVLTYLATHEEKLGGEIGAFMKEKMNPFMEAEMKKEGWDIVPYVNVWGTTPDKGYVQFFDSPRYSSGYTALFNTPSYVIETHMLKPYQQRTLATYAFLKKAIMFLEQHGDALSKAKEDKIASDLKAESLAINWSLDSSKVDQITFKGYEGSYKASEVSGLPRLFYDRSKPYEKKIPFYSGLQVTKEEKKPDFFVIPRAWGNVIAALEHNHIKMTQLEADQKMKVDVKYIDRYQTVKSPYEGHYLHYDIATVTKSEEVQFRKGDYLIPTAQRRVRFLMETLTPEAKDSFFAWNYFDPILQQKEHFSSYVFEDKAIDILAKNPELKEALEQKKKEDKHFKNSAYQQLEFIYEHSDHKEKSHLRYPIYKYDK